MLVLPPDRRTGGSWRSGGRVPSGPASTRRFDGRSCAGRALGHRAAHPDAVRARPARRGTARSGRRPARRCARSSIEKPVENISVSTTSRAPSAAAALDHRREAREVRRRVLPHDVVLDRGDLHLRAEPSAACTPRRAPRGACRTRSARAGAPASRRRRRRRSGPRRRRTARAATRQNARPSVSPSDADVGGDEVGAGGREHGRSPASASPRAQPVALVAQVGARTRRSTSSGSASPAAIACWNGAAVHVGEELLRRAHRGDELGRRARPSRSSSR